MSQIKISLYIIIPFIWGMFSVFAYIIALQISNFFSRFDYAVLIYYAVGGILFCVSSLVGYILLKTVLKPTEELFARLKKKDNTGSKELNDKKYSSGKKADYRSRIFSDQLGEFKEVFGKIAIGSNIKALQEQFPKIIFQSREMAYVLEQVLKVAPSNAGVLILGESGTGKELIADAIHEKSRRSDGPFIKINCGAISTGLLESELFGHDKGAFTGATGTHKGSFERADKGSLFLDEIGELPADVQVKLLRVLQNGEFQRVGGQKTFNVDVRIIAATNRALEKDVAAGKFRQDLFYRLNVFNINLPPLNNRKGDIELLADYFVQKNDKKISDKTIQLLCAYEWKGNIRQLENKIAKACICTQNDILNEEDFDLGNDMDMKFFLQKSQDITENLTDINSDANQPFDMTAELNRIEINFIVNALEKNSGVQARAAEMLGIKPRSLWNRIKKFEIDVGKFK